MDKFLSHYDKLLMDEGFDSLSLNDKNLLVNYMAKQSGQPVLNIDPEFVLNYHKNLKIEYLRENVEAEICVGFTATNGHTYRTNRDDQINMIGQKDELVEDETITEVHWKTENAGYVLHTKEEWLTVYREAFAHKKAKLFKYNTLKQQVLSAETHDELLEIKW